MRLQHGAQKYCPKRDTAREVKAREKAEKARDEAEKVAAREAARGAVLVDVPCLWGNVRGFRGNVSKHASSRLSLTPCSMQRSEY